MKDPTDIRQFCQVLLAIIGVHRWKLSGVCRKMYFDYQFDAV